MKIFRLLAVVMAGLAAASPISLLAHPTGEHVQGVASSITKSSIVVQVNASQSKTVLLTETTKFEKVDAPATRANVKVGDKVVVHAVKKGQDLVATLVRFAPASPSGSTPKK
jgi:hypothetical protein